MLKGLESIIVDETLKDSDGVEMLRGENERLKIGFN
jgi:hypothetical protein